MTLASLALLTLLGLGAAQPVPPTLPESYTATIQLNMPYISLTEPMKVSVSSSLKKQAISYWNGMDTYITDYSGDAGAQSYQIIPTSTDGLTGMETCWYFDGSEASSEPPTVLYPDFSTFSYLEQRVVNGVSCNGWRLVQPEFNSTSGNIGTYTFYADAATGDPVRYQFVGHNAVLGGHFDAYHMDYISFSSGEPDSSAFDPSSVTGISGVSDCVPLPEFDDDDSGGPTVNVHGPTPHLHHEDFDMLHPHSAPARADAAEAHFKEFDRDHQDEERHVRYGLYHNARRYVNSLNRRKETYKLAVNKFADWTEEEKRAVRGRVRTSKEEMEKVLSLSPPLRTHSPSLEDLPSEIDWRPTGAVTPVKDQGTCGSCWSYGTTGSLEGQLWKAGGATGQAVPLSQQNLMDCSWPEGNNACDGGLDYNAWSWIKSHGGLATYASYGSYLNADGFCHFSDSDVVVGGQISGYVNVTEGSVDDMNDALANVGPLSVSIDASPDSFYYYAGGYYSNAECKNGVDDLDHTVLAVGYVEGPDGLYTIVKNSWSTYWGDEGYVYIKQEGNICGVATTPTYPVVA